MFASIFTWAKRFLGAAVMAAVVIGGSYVIYASKPAGNPEATIESGQMDLAKAPQQNVRVAAVGDGKTTLAQVPKTESGATNPTDLERLTQRLEQLFTNKFDELHKNLAGQLSEELKSRKEAVDRDIAALTGRLDAIETAPKESSGGAPTAGSALFTEGQLKGIAQGVTESIVSDPKSPFRTLQEEVRQERVERQKLDEKIKNLPTTSAAPTMTPDAIRQYIREEIEKLLNPKSSEGKKFFDEIVGEVEKRTAAKVTALQNQVRTLATAVDTKATKVALENKAEKSAVSTFATTKADKSDITALTGRVTALAGDVAHVNGELAIQTPLVNQMKEEWAAAQKVANTQPRVPAPTPAPVTRQPPGASAQAQGGLDERCSIPDAVFSKRLQRCVR